MPSWWQNLDWVLPLRHAALTPAFALFTALGSMIGYLVIALLLAWLWRPAFINRLLPMIGISALANGWLKMFFQDPRPASRFVIPGHGATGFGMPSGHAQLAVLFWGALALELGRTKPRGWPWMMVGALAVAALIAFSRPYLGVHDVQDVTVGMAIGLGLLGLFRLLGHRPDTAPPLLVAGLFSVACGVAWLSWPGGPDGQAVAPALAMMAGWYGSQMILATKAEILAGSAGQKILLAAAGLGFLLALHAGALQILPDWPAKILLLFCVGVTGIAWPLVTDRLKGWPASA
jgi:membrane-associated phospholipid phosphatase